MKKHTGHILLAGAAVFLMGTLTPTLASCGNQGSSAVDPNAVAAKLESEDGKYEYQVTNSWTCWINAKGGEDKIAEGSFNIREENGAVTIILDGEAQTVTNGTYSYSFTYDNTAKNVSAATFTTIRYTFLKQLGADGPILEAEDKNSSASGGGAGSSFSMTPSLVFWNTGRLELKIIKVQAAISFTFDQTAGLKISETEKQLTDIGQFVCTEDTSAQTYTVAYTDLNITLPFGMSTTGSVTFDKSLLNQAYGLA
jgi:hypothetical protein